MYYYLYRKYLEKYFRKVFRVITVNNDENPVIIVYRNISNH